MKEIFTHYEVCYEVFGELYVTSSEFKTIEEAMEYAEELANLCSKNECSMKPVSIQKFTSEAITYFR